MTYLLLLVAFFQNFQQDTSPNFFHTPLLTIARALHQILLTVKEGLDRFQKSFKQFQKMQVSRFFIFDVFVPFVAAGTAIFFLIH